MMGGMGGRGGDALDPAAFTRPFLAVTSIDDSVFRWIMWRDPQETVRGFTARLAARTMRLAAKAPGEWGVVWGAFRIPPGTGSLRLVLGQAAGSAPHDGSAAWFDDVGVFLFDSDEEARAAVPVFEKRYPPSP